MIVILILQIIKYGAKIFFYNETNMLVLNIDCFQDFKRRVNITSLIIIIAGGRLVLLLIFFFCFSEVGETGAFSLLRLFRLIDLSHGLHPGLAGAGAGLRNVLCFFLTILVERTIERLLRHAAPETKIRDGRTELRR